MLESCRCAWSAVIAGSPEEKWKTMENQGEAARSIQQLKGERHKKTERGGLKEMRQRDGKKMDITALADFSSNKQVELAWTTSLPIATGNDKG